MNDTKRVIYFIYRVRYKEEWY